MATNIWPRLATMSKEDSSWKRVKVPSVVWCLVFVIVFGQCAGGKQMSETLQRALSAVRGPSPGAKKLLNIPEDGGESDFFNLFRLPRLKCASVCQVTNFHGVYSYV